MKPFVLRAQSGALIGRGHVARTRAVAQALGRIGAHLCIVVDDEPSRDSLREEGLEAYTHDELPDWPSRPTRAAWLDGMGPWSDELETLERAGVPSVLIDNRRADRGRAWRVIYPHLHHRPDAWDRAHSDRVLSGALWIPFAGEYSASLPLPAPAKDVELLVSFGASDPEQQSERIVGLLPADLGRVVLVVGPYMRPRLAALERAASGRGRTEVAIAPASLRPWIERSRVAVTALGTTLNELALLRVPGLVLARREDEREALELYTGRGPHRALGIMGELDDEQLRSRLIAGHAALLEVVPPQVPGLGEGAQRIAELLVRAGDGC